jgi:hypothetical protein
MANAHVYLETSFFRYLIAKPSSEATKADRQEITRLWWSTRRHDFALRVSQIVYDEFHRRRGTDRSGRSGTACGAVRSG